MKGEYETALKLHKAHLSLAQELGDYAAQGRAYGNMGNAYHALGIYDQAVRYHRQELQISLEQYLSLSPGLQDLEGEGKVCHNLAYAHYCLGQYKDAVRYYEQDLALAKDLQDKLAQAKAYCNLGLAHKALGEYSRAEESLSFHSQELTLRKDLADPQGECRALGHLAAVHMAQGDYTTTFQCYETQLGLAQGLRDARLEAQVHGNMGITKMNMGAFEEAIGYFEQQLAMLQQLSGSEGMLDRGRAYGNLADCYDALGDYEEAIQYYEKYLTVAQSLNHVQDQEKAYRGLGNAHRSMGSLQQALVCFEKRLVVAHELGGEGGGKAQAYGELGTLHSQLGNYEQALSCLEHQLSIARSAGWHQRALRIAEQTGCVRSQGRAYGNLGLTYEALGNYERAVVFQEQHLSVAAQTNDLIAKTLAYGSLGRTHHALQNYTQAVMYLQEGDACDTLTNIHTSLYWSPKRRHGLRLAEQLGQREDEAKIRHRLGLSLWAGGRHDEALAIAERGRTRAFADLLVERQRGSKQAASADPYIPVTVEHILETVNGQKALVLYYSLAGGFLYSWLISPGTGILKFNEVYLGEAGLETSEFQDGGGSLHGGGPLSLDQYICNAREALGVDIHHSSSETESEAGDLLEQQFEELNNNLTSATDPTGYLRMGLMHNSGPVGRNRQLVVVLEGELYLIPFALLKGSSSNEYLYERFNIISVPSLASLQAASKPHPRSSGPLLCPDGGSVVAVVGNPHLPPSVMDRWLWGPLPSAQDEALSLGEQLGCHPLTEVNATKERVLAALNQAECVHFATHISWKLAALVLAPSQERTLGDMPSSRPKENTLCGKSALGEAVDQEGEVECLFPKSCSSPGRLRGVEERSEDGESVCGVESVCDSMPLHDFLLTAADILDLCLTVKLVVLRLYPESNCRITADGVVGLTRAFLAAGIRCVCISLWPVQIAASKLFMHTFYTALLNGTKASVALTEAMKNLQSSKHFSHPSNWAGYMLIGSDVKLNSPMSLVGQALAEILQYPEKARDALRVLLHLVEKSLQRIQSGHCFDLCEVGQEEVVLKTGKQASRRNMHFALQALLALFESLSSSQSASQPHSLPVSLSCHPPQPSFLPPGCSDNLSCDAISVYSLSSLASSLSFLTRPEPAGSDIISHRSHQQEPVKQGGGTGLYSLQRHTGGLSRGRLTNHGGGLAGGEDEEYEGFSIISSEPLGRAGRECDTLPLPGGHRQGKGGSGQGSVLGQTLTVSSKGSISTPTSPLKAPPLVQADPTSPKVIQKISESDQSSTETDSTIKSQEERMGPAGQLDPHELAQKILEETHSHMQAVETLQKANTRVKALRGAEGQEDPYTRQPSLSMPTTPTLKPARGACGFQPSETSAFSRPPSRASLKACSSPFSVHKHLSPLSTTDSRPPPTPPKPPSRSSSLQKINTTTPSSPSLYLPVKEKHSPLIFSSSEEPIQAQHKPKYSGSPYSCHISPSRSPADSAPSPALSYSSTGSVSTSSSPANASEPSQSKQDNKVQAMHNLKTFWASVSQKQEAPNPATLLRGGNKKISTVQKDVLGLLNLSPRRGSGRKHVDRQEDCDRPNGHRKLEPKPPLTLSASLPTNIKGGIKLPSGNGYKFLSPGQFFPSSKC
ncbi:hypothetical protein GOODEAATRI_003329 [Goodea atripinnis]|uniref:Tetratricopeptide repeat domain 28 n=1 Tax=Goodea atripinnis TaxID=208336 RepID=A0ABV0PB27_9TELE